MDDSALYTGVDGEVEGVFGNEKPSKEIDSLLKEQDRKLKELTPKLEGIIETIDAERDLIIRFITEYVDNTKDDDSLMRAELKAAARYRQYLDGLKTKFILQLNETKRHD